jgi:hypothetical protein
VPAVDEHRLPAQRLLRPVANEDHVDELDEHVG